MNFDMQAHLASRHFNPELYSGLTVTDSNMTLLMWNLSGQAAGYQVYTPLFPKKAPEPHLARYFSYVTKGQSPMWGAETLAFGGDFVYLTEGVFDACRLHNAGLPALAVFCNRPSTLRSFLKSLPRTVIAVCQGDKAGRKLAEFGDTALYLPGGEDVGSLSDRDFFSFFGCNVTKMLAQS